MLKSILWAAAALAIYIIIVVWFMVRFVDMPGGASNYHQTMIFDNQKYT